MSEKKTLNFEGKKLKYYKTFNLFGEVAYIAKYTSKYWEVFLQKKNGDFGRLGALTLTAKNAVEAAIDRVESFAMRQGVTNQEVMTMILK